MNRALLALGAALLLQDPKPADNFIEVRMMLRGYCHAGSAVVDKDAPGGFAKSDNLPKPLPRELKVVDGKLQLIAEPETVTAFGKGKGMTLRLVNATKVQAAFRASDSRLPIGQEAKDAKGEWKPIEYLPSSWCGNSYHKVFLGPGEQWEFATPRYKGPVKTTLRFVLEEGREGGKRIVSNEFEGSVHPEQFSDKEGHAPGGIMDPYND